MPTQEANGLWYQGIPEPKDDKCSAKLHAKDEDDGSEERPLRVGRYCSLSKGHGTKHKGHGRCKYHGGNNPSGEIAAYRDQAAAEYQSIYGAMEAPKLNVIEVEMTALATDAKRGYLAARQMVENLESLETEDVHGVLRIRPVVQLYEDRMNNLFNMYDKLMKNNLQRFKAEISQAQANMLWKMFQKILYTPVLKLTDYQITVATRMLVSEIEKRATDLMPDWIDQLIDEDDVDIDDDTIVDAEIVDLRE